MNDCPATPRRPRLSRTVRKRDRQGFAELRPEEYFSDSKKRAPLENSDFDKGLFREFFDKSIQALQSNQQLGENYELVQINHSVHLSRLELEESQPDAPPGRLLSPRADSAQNRAFLGEVQRLEGAAARLSLTAGDRNRLQELLREAAGILTQARKAPPRPITFGQFLKSTSNCEK